jgi:hypothetical protein
MLALVLCSEAIAISVAAIGFNGSTSEEVAIGATFASFFGLFACIFAIAIAVGFSQSPSKFIERELRAALSKHSPQQA